MGTDVRLQTTGSRPITATFLPLFVKVVAIAREALGIPRIRHGSSILAAVSPTAAAPAPTAATTATRFVAGRVGLGGGLSLSIGNHFGRRRLLGRRPRWSRGPGRPLASRRFIEQSGTEAICRW